MYQRQRGYDAMCYLIIQVSESGADACKNEDVRMYVVKRVIRWVVLEFVIVSTERFATWKMRISEVGHNTFSGPGSEDADTFDVKCNWRDLLLEKL